MEIEIEADDDGSRYRPKLSWRRTVLTQAALCVAFFAAYNIGKPRGVAVRDEMDLYFISVRGGAWPIEEQRRLLWQMEKAVKTYEVKFVVNICEAGDDDPLMRNATLHSPSLKIPWYTTTSSHGQVTKNFLKNIKLPHDQVLDIIGLDSWPFQNFLRDGELSEVGKEQLSWMHRTLASRDSNWRVIVGFDQLIACGEQLTEGIKLYEPLYKIFLKYRVNAYLSQRGCAGYHYDDGGVVYLGHPGTEDNKHISDHLISVNHDIPGGMDSGFLLHRVSALELESYYIDSRGQIVFRSTIQQHGKGDM